jgi:hypothetical protein
MALNSGADTSSAETIWQMLMTRAGAFAICNLIDVLNGPSDFELRRNFGKIPESQRPWYMGGFALVLSDVRKIPFVACGGAPGLFGIHPDAYARLEIAA